MTPGAPRFHRRHPSSGRWRPSSCYFRDDLRRIARAPGSRRCATGRGRAEARRAALGWYLIVGTIPIVIFGVRVQEPDRETAPGDLYLIGTMLIVFGLRPCSSPEKGLAPAERGRHDDHAAVTRSSSASPRRFRARPRRLTLGARTISGRPVARARPACRPARFSFLLSIPAVVLSGLYELKGRRQTAAPRGAVRRRGRPRVRDRVSRFVNRLPCRSPFLLKFLTTHTTAVFVAYRVGARRGRARACGQPARSR